MRLTIKNFGGFGSTSEELHPGTEVVRPNRAGKTTIINAYVFALSGRTLSGFEARNIFASPEDVTEVTLDGFMPWSIRRVLTPGKGTTLYINGDVMTQKEFNTFLDVDLAVACANVNILTESSLSSEQLRRLLISADVMAADDAAELRNKLRTLNAKRKEAEKYACVSVSEHPVTAEPLTEAERAYMVAYEIAQDKVRKRVSEFCECCGQLLPAAAIAQQRRDYGEAKEIIERTGKECARIREKELAYAADVQQANKVKSLIALTVKARRDVQTLTREIEETEVQIRAADAAALASSDALPAGVEVRTENVAKNGNVSSVCSLTFNGVPLKSVNRGDRIRVCVDMLDRARRRKGYEFVPILIDNAESVQNVDKYDNVIQFKVG